MNTKYLDVICLGRAAVDLYGQQIGSRLEDESSFAKYLGGSSGNIAYGTARLGLKSAMLTRVGNEHMGRFVKEELSRAGVDVSHVKTDNERLTGLVLLGIKDQDTFPLIFYRNDCADMAISVEDFDPEFIASSKSLLITGTHFSTEHTFHTSLQAMKWAREQNTKVILDIDYRPVLWGLTGLGEGENRFVSADNVTQHLQTILPYCDLIVGTEEEFHIAGGSTNTVNCLSNIRRLTDAVLVVKRGPLGCSVFPDNIPEKLDDGLTVHGVKVEVLNVLGAGDAFMSGFLSGWLRDKSLTECCQLANACGAIVVSRHGCAPATPTEEELNYYLANAENISRPDVDPHLNYLHRVTTRHPVNWDEVCALAFDHRKQFVEMVNETGTKDNKIAVLKKLLLKATQLGADKASLTTPGVLIDDTFGRAALNEVSGKDWWVGRPVELPGSRPVNLEGKTSIGSRLVSWPSEHIVKCLVFYHPDDELTLRHQQEQQVISLYEDCCASGHEFLLEVIPPKDLQVNDDTIPRALKRFYNLGVYPDWWKLPPQSGQTWQQVQQLITNRAPHCRGVVILGLDSPVNELKKGFKTAAAYPIVKGFAVGRSIFAEAARQWLKEVITDEQFIELVANNYQQLIDVWRASRQ
ncbi:5-dehydro-2-deoxygluconokinase [Endozoicomonas sp. SM1973]|uniref:5-dehydro-2-deoxygluconokinase n=1 Tax=Spartinivicinus marinus TaxID=2994442 RepID=A0A853I5X7_9GAMM|nr:5-dehydro-2-deoxygluconokinase [Spartinivicinus marinus]MCX4025944.1 5-dehydro-2-deoxygluconokinase [Spartinivicinus marinus]NYZ68129.1 5-dehydro-2-deoxygluconokinase [Spartinivicinus marinus]